MDIPKKIIAISKLEEAYQDSESLHIRREEAIYQVKKQFEDEKESLLRNIKEYQIELGIRKSLNYHVEISDRITYVNRIGSDTIMVHRDQEVPFDEYVFDFFEGALDTSDTEVIIWKGYCYPLSSGPKLVEFGIIPKESYKTLIMNKIISK